MRAEPVARRAPTAIGASLGVVGSVVVHVASYLLLSWVGAMPKVDFELALPSNVEFGLTEPTAIEPTGAPVAAAPEASSKKVETPDDGQQPKPDRAKRHQPADAGTTDAGVASSQARDAGMPSSKPGPASLSAFAPAGALISLRLHIASIRNSELADDVRALLEAIPDWRLIVEGSELEPLRDLERLYLASPDLRRASVVIAGQYAGDEDVPRRAVEKLAAARGVSASFSQRGTIAVAPWPNADETERVVALIAPHQFVITRPMDLPRVLQVATALARRNRIKRKSAGSSAAESEPGEALLGLLPNEVLAFSVEGARLFARGNIEGVPQRLELSVRERAEGGFGVLATAHYENEAVAEPALDYWERTRKRFANHPLVAIIGMRGPLADGVTQRQGAVLEFSTRVSTQQARVLLGSVRNALDDRSGASAPPARTSSPNP